MRFHILLSVVAALMPVMLQAQDYPTIDPQATVTTDDGEEQDNAYSGSAPLHVSFAANAENTSGWDCIYEWRFYTEGNSDSPYLTRYEENTEYTFETAGANYIVLYATFIQGTDTVAYTEEYWQENTPITMTISESELNMPNAFSPNGDGINDIYKPKAGYKSIVEFKAYIFNRWGQKLYEWSDPSTGWDGTYNGKDVKQGVYFCLVKARGADGRQFNIKTDVNLLRGYTESSGANGSEQ